MTDVYEMENQNRFLKAKLEELAEKITLINERNKLSKMQLETVSEDEKEELRQLKFEISRIEVQKKKIGKENKEIMDLCVTFEDGMLGSHQDLKRKLLDSVMAN